MSLDDDEEIAPENKLPQLLGMCVWAVLLAPLLPLVYTVEHPWPVLASFLVWSVRLVAFACMVMLTLAAMTSLAHHPGRMFGGEPFGNGGEIRLVPWFNWIFLAIGVPAAVWAWYSGQPNAGLWVWLYVTPPVAMVLGIFASIRFAHAILACILWLECTFLLVPLLANFQTGKYAEFAVATFLFTSLLGVFDAPTGHPLGNRWLGGMTIISVNVILASVLLGM